VMGNNLAAKNTKEKQVKMEFPGGGNCILAPPTVLLGIRRSHLCYPHKWREHIAYYHTLGAAFPDAAVTVEINYGRNGIRRSQPKGLRSMTWISRGIRLYICSPCFQGTPS
jgi:hypothetical protein